MLFKMKADQMRLIYECLSGENGLLYNDTERKNFFEFIKNKDSKEIAIDEDIVDCELCNKNYDPELDFVKWTRQDRDNFYKQPMTLLEFMEHEVFHEYEKAKRAIFDKDLTLAKQDPNNLDGLDRALFHPIFLSTLMNQTVFRRECMIQKIERRKIYEAGVEEVQLEKEKRSENCKYIEVIKKSLSNIEVQGYQTLLKDKNEK